MLAFLLAVGFAAVFGMFDLWLVLIVGQMRSSDNRYQDVQVRADGIPLVQVYFSSFLPVFVFGWSGGAGRVWQCFFCGGADLMGPDAPYDLLGQRSWERRIFILSDLGRPPIYWYFVHDGEWADTATSSVSIAKLKSAWDISGRTDFGLSEPPREEQFSVPRASMQYLSRANRWNPRYLPFVTVMGTGDEDDILQPWFFDLVSGDRLETINLRDRSVRTLFELPGLLSSAVGTKAFAKLPDKNSKPSETRQRFRVARTADRLLLLLPQRRRT